jgi:hypothetical protein
VKRHQVPFNTPSSFDPSKNAVVLVDIENCGKQLQVLHHTIRNPKVSHIHICYSGYTTQINLFQMKEIYDALKEFPNKLSFQTLPVACKAKNAADFVLTFIAGMIVGKMNQVHEGDYQKESKANTQIVIFSQDHDVQIAAMKMTEQGYSVSVFDGVKFFLDEKEITPLGRKFTNINYDTVTELVCNFIQNNPNEMSNEIHEDLLQWIDGKIYSTIKSSEKSHITLKKLSVVVTNFVQSYMEEFKIKEEDKKSIILGTEKDLATLIANTVLNNLSTMELAEIDGVLSVKWTRQAPPD